MKVTSSEFAALVSEAMEDIPPSFQRHMRDVTIDVEPIPDIDTCRRMGIPNLRSLLGLYHGTPLTRRSVEQLVKMPDRITIYQRNIERICSTREQIIRQVRKTVFHEVGHHFGLSEHDLDELGFG